VRIVRGTADLVAESQAALESQHRSAKAMVMATPSKSRSLAGSFGPSHSSHMHYSTPIREEPLSAERQRPTFIAETPVAPGRHSANPFSSDGVAETPMASRRLSDLAFNGLDSVNEDEDSDPLADLMVLTDDEDERE